MATLIVLTMKKCAATFCMAVMVWMVTTMLNWRGDSVDGSGNDEAVIG